MFEKITKSIQKIGKFSEQNLADFTDKLHLKTVPKDAVLLQKGQVCNAVYFVKSGSFRQYRINEENEELKSRYLKEHVNSIKLHVEQLGNKNYQDLYQIESPDFVLLFIPMEPAFAIALNEDTTLYNKAFEKNIVIVTPSTLLLGLDHRHHGDARQPHGAGDARARLPPYDGDRPGHGAS